jgi:hypothetical protein
MPKHVQFTPQRLARSHAAVGEEKNARDHNKNTFLLLQIQGAILTGKTYFPCLHQVEGMS